MEDKITELLHQTIGGAALPLLMSSDLGSVIKKIVRVTFNDAYVGCVYVDDLDQIFTLSSKLYRINTSPDSNQGIATISLSDFQANTLKYLKQIGYPLNFRSQNSLKLDVKDIDAGLLSEIKPLEEMYNQSTNRDLHHAFPTLASLKQGLKEVINTLIQKKYLVNQATH